MFRRWLPAKRIEVPASPVKPLSQLQMEMGWTKPDPELFDPFDPVEPQEKRAERELQLLVDDIEGVSIIRDGRKKPFRATWGTGKSRLTLDFETLPQAVACRRGWEKMGRLR